MRKEIRIFIEDTLKSIEKIERYTKEMSREEFFKKDETQDAVMRRLEIIGEAVKATLILNRAEARGHSILALLER